MPVPAARPDQAARAPAGRPQRLVDLAHLQDWLEPRLGRVRCVSFDVFDTLLARCIEPPDAVLERLAQLVADQLPAYSCAQVLGMRREAEHALRQEMLAQGLDHECHHDTLVQAWVVRLAGQRDVLLEPSSTPRSAALKPWPWRPSLVPWPCWAGCASSRCG